MFIEFVPVRLRISRAETVGVCDRMTRTMNCGDRKRQEEKGKNCYLLVDWCMRQSINQMASPNEVVMIRLECWPTSTYRSCPAALTAVQILFVSYESIRHVLVRWHTINCRRVLV